jgi:hypothetical protein
VKIKDETKAVYHKVPTDEGQSGSPLISFNG